MVRKLEPSPVTPPCPKLLTEIELMNILNEHKCPQIVRKKITEWISKGHTTRPGFDFSNFRYRKTDVIMKELSSDSSLSTLTVNKFHCAFINWLPNNKPTEI